MYIIEKCTHTNVNAAYAREQSHLWQRAWSGDKAYFDCRGTDEAIVEFTKRTSKVKNAPYRLRVAGEPLTLAAINSLDADSFRKYTIAAIGFRAGECQSDKQSVQHSIGVVVPGSMGAIVGHSNSIAQSVQERVETVAQVLSATISSHGVTVRYNSNGLSGGAFLITSVSDGILSNSDIGITCDDQHAGYSLLVSHKFLKDPASGNRECPWTKRMDHASSHEHLSDALSLLRQIVRVATEEDLIVLAIA